MDNAVATLVGRLTPDPWRESAGFSADIDQVHSALFGDRITDGEVVEILGHWLQRYQPCVFGRIAAKHRQLSYCVILDHELDMADVYLRDKIKEARLQWTASAFDGVKSGFIVVVVSRRIAFATPNDVMRALAAELGSLYLLEPVETDRIYLDEAFLEMPGSRRTAWAWYAGVNYFCAQADRRWWHDHRVPGGMAFSVNSVGHMVKSGVLARGMKELAEIMDAPGEDRELRKLESLGDALSLAMQTISIASEAVSGRATWLLPLPVGSQGLPPCPVALPRALAAYNHCAYQGHYHTDYTLPSEYFVADVERPSAVGVHNLDFTYLFDDSLDNPDHLTMGEGRKIRGVMPGEDEGAAGELAALAVQRRARCAERIVSIGGHPTLAAALEGRHG